LLANQGDCGYVPGGEGDGDGADVAEDDMEATPRARPSASPRAWRAPTRHRHRLAGRTLQAGPCGLAGGPGRPRTNAPGAADAWLLALTGQRATRARTV